MKNNSKIVNKINSIKELFKTCNIFQHYYGEIKESDINNILYFATYQEGYNVLKAEIVESDNEFMYFNKQYTSMEDLKKEVETGITNLILKLHLEKLDKSQTKILTFKIVEKPVYTEVIRKFLNKHNQYINNVYFVYYHDSLYRIINSETEYDSIKEKLYNEYVMNNNIIDDDCNIYIECIQNIFLNTYEDIKESLYV